MKLSLNTTALFAGIILFSTACVKKPSTPAIPIVETPTSNEVHFNFENYFGDKEIELNTATYTTGQNEDITLTTFNYWITNIKLKKSDGTYFTEDESYRLMRGDKHATLHFHIEDVPAGTYTGIEFMIGVDVPRNTSGAQTGPGCKWRYVLDLEYRLYTGKTGRNFSSIYRSQQLSAISYRWCKSRLRNAKKCIFNLCQCNRSRRKSRCNKDQNRCS